MLKGIPSGGRLMSSQGEKVQGGAVLMHDPSVFRL